MEQINFILPNFRAYSRNEILINLYKKYPQILLDNSIIYSFYGDFPKTLFNGGRVVDQIGNYSIREIKKIKKFYNSNNIKITLTFTNQCLEKRHLKDKFCNQLLKVFNDGYNEVLVASPLLEDYIRKNYPKYKINKSITATIKDGNEDYSKYNLLVIDKKNNRNFEYLKSIEDKDRIEILCDETCVNDCKYTNDHYKEISLYQLGIRSTSEKFGVCRYSNKGINYQAIKYRNENSKYYISSKDIVDKYASLGYKYFKLSGRERYNLIGTESIISYLVKDKYQNDIETYIYERMFLELESDIKHGRE